MLVFMSLWMSLFGLKGHQIGLPDREPTNNPIGSSKIDTSFACLASTYKPFVLFPIWPSFESFKTRKIRLKILRLACVYPSCNLQQLGDRGVMGGQGFGVSMRAGRGMGRISSQLGQYPHFLIDSRLIGQSSKCIGCISVTLLRIVKLIQCGSVSFTKF